jgi:hypothetical protein
MADEFSLPQPKADKYYTLQPFRVPKYRVKFQNARRLTDVPGYVWYSPAALYLWGMYEEKNLADMVRAMNAKFFWYRFDFPIFSGLVSATDNAWNHTLWAAEETQWPQILDMVLETVQFNIPQQLLFQFALQQVEVYDPLSLDLSRAVLPSTPRTNVKFFAVQSNLQQYALELKGRDPHMPPAVRRFKPDKLHVAAARTLFRNPNLTQDNAFSSYREILRCKHKCCVREKSSFKTKTYKK